MHSSTSSSEGAVARPDWRVVASIAVAVLSVELATNLLAPVLSNEVAFLETIPAVASALNHNEAPSILVLGNSLAKEGLPERELNSAAANASLHAAFKTVALNGATLPELYWLLRLHFTDEGHIPDMLLLPLNLRAVTANTLKISRTALFAKSKAWTDIIASQDLQGFERKAAFLHSLLSSAMAQAPRVRLAILKPIVPNYDTITLDMHSRSNSSAPSVESPADLEALTRILNLCAAQGILPVVLYMPEMTHYDVPAVVDHAVKGAGGHILDLRSTPELAKEHFADGSHLNATGASVLAPLVVTATAELLPPAQ